MLERREPLGDLGQPPRLDVVITLTALPLAPDQPGISQHL